MLVIISFIPTKSPVLRSIRVWQNRPWNVVFALLPVNSKGRRHTSKRPEVQSFTYTFLFCTNFQNFEEIEINIASPGCGNTCLHEELQVLLWTQTELVTHLLSTIPAATAVLKQVLYTWREETDPFLTLSCRTLHGFSLYNLQAWYRHRKRLKLRRVWKILAANSIANCRL